MSNDGNREYEVVIKKKHNIFCEVGFILGLFSFFYSGFFVIPVLSAIISFVGLATYKNSRHRDKWKAYWGLFFGIMLALTNLV
jgi:hypothetical protein